MPVGCKKVCRAVGASRRKICKARLTAVEQCQQNQESNACSTQPTVKFFAECNHASKRAHVGDYRCRKILLKADSYMQLVVSSTGPVRIHHATVCGQYRLDFGQHQVQNHILKIGLIDIAKIRLCHTASTLYSVCTPPTRILTTLPEDSSPRCSTL